MCHSIIIEPSTIYMTAHCSDDISCAPSFVHCYTKKHVVSGFFSMGKLTCKHACKTAYKKAAKECRNQDSNEDCLTDARKQRAECKNKCKHVGGKSRGLSEIALMCSLSISDRRILMNGFL